MSKRKKLLERLFSKPKDFEWNELRTLLTGFGYQEISGAGSRVKFYDSKSDSLINLHKPHPSNIVKEYVLDQVVEILEGRGIRP